MAEATTTPQEEQEPVRSGWFRSPGGVLSHADGPSQVRSYLDRGYSKVDDEQALAEVGDGIQLHVDRRDAKGTFDEVRKAVAEESGGRRPRARRQQQKPGEGADEPKG
jgi:hypothetical protein